jgi:hypothetical protein
MAISEKSKMQLRQKYSTELKALIGRSLTKQDGVKRALLATCEKRLKLKLPTALRTYYELAGNLPINKEHNIFYDPKDLTMREGKLVFMEENQAVVFWGMDIKTLNQPDPEVFQANETPVIWYSEELSCSDFIIKAWRWQRGLDNA